ncbi:hypothetical protein [Rhodoferax sp. TH121]|uniref:hypothetical protein n=1 Tax=Rhodoferax sp. TH121 TaxID=2022803 RepID=UPI0020CF034C|nr:hypothetical protein [Rhodoferax sp. TH121]
MPKTSHLAFACATAFALTAAHGTPTLRCQLTYAGSTQTLDATPVRNPYPVASVDVGGRFRFKVVAVGEGTQLEYIKLYAYLDTRRQPVLVQQATYLPPFVNTSSLTGKQFVYAGEVERELQYECGLQGVAP